MKLQHQVKNCIAVLGGAGSYTDAQVIAGFQIGREIARNGMNLVTGATTGIPYAAAIGAASGGATVMGFSPATDFEEHVTKYKKPFDFVDIIAYPGMGLEGRQPLIVRTAKGCIFVGGEFGTMAEFSAAFTIGDNVLGVLEGYGGITDQIRAIRATMESNYGSLVIFDSDPVQLADRVCTEVALRYPVQSIQAQCADIGSDVRETISRFLNEEDQRLCVTPWENMLTGVM